MSSWQIQPLKSGALRDVSIAETSKKKKHFEFSQGVPLSISYDENGN
jgi:hypothetical protein